MQARKPPQGKLNEVCRAAIGGSGGFLAICDLTRTGATAIGHVIKSIINGPLRSEAFILEGLSNGSVIAAGMDKGDGSTDVHTDLWMPKRQGFWIGSWEVPGRWATKSPILESK